MQWSLLNAPYHDETVLFFNTYFSLSDLFPDGITKGFISVALIVFGAFVAGARDLSFNAYGYSIVFIANITTAIYLATIARIGSIYILTFFLYFSVMWLYVHTVVYIFHFQESPAVSIALVSCGAMVIMALP